MKAPSATELRLTRARVQLLLTHPFFASLCMRLDLRESSIPTMATNGKTIYYNPAFVESLTPAELQGVLAHEVMHCALAHQCRRGVRDTQLWNEAADLAINPIILNNGLTLPADAHVDHQYQGMSAEEIYARLLDQKGGGDGESDPSGAQDAATGSDHSPTPSQSSGDDGSQEEGQSSEPGSKTGPAAQARPGGFGEVLDATDEMEKPASEAEMHRQENQWKIAAEQAMKAAKSCGKGSADVERLLEEERQSKQDWRAILRDFIAATTPCDYTWSPPNRRHISAGLYLPSIRREGIGPVVIGVDTSGSVGPRELEEFASEISAIADQAQPEAIHVVYCDEAVTSTQQFQPSEPITLEPRGGAGTSFRPVFQWVEQNNIDPACLIYLTDLDCHEYPESEPGYPVLWVTNSRRNAPFGETVRILAD
ncbi:MAG TPA: VWA-like domain-containing protein [Candidatus Angelobacter sp.]|nr:VWA-like domain-containing protein [Candidatus Angelobacter sp.]